MTTVLGGNNSIMLDYHRPLLNAAGFTKLFTFGGPSLTEYIRQDGIFFDDLFGIVDKTDLYMSAYKIYTGSLHAFCCVIRS